MLDHILGEVLLAHLKTVPTLATSKGYTGQDVADHKLPGLTVVTWTLKAKSICGQHDVRKLIKAWHNPVALATGFSYIGGTMMHRNARAASGASASGRNT